MPDAKTLARLGQLTGPKVVEQIHERGVELAERGGTGGGHGSECAVARNWRQALHGGSKIPQTDFGDPCGGKSALA